MAHSNWRVLRATDHRHMRWKNGLGTTTEIVIEPPGATLETFTWRLSMARIEADGPFSCFADVDRLTLALDGELDLIIDGRRIALKPDEPAVSFAGESAVEAVLSRTSAGTSCPALDLNLMVRRGRYVPRMYRHVFEDAGELTHPEEVTALISRTPGVRVFNDKGRSENLDVNEVLVATSSEPHPLRFSCKGTAEIFICELRAL